MAFSDPQTVTINSVAKSCARVSSDQLRSVYKTSDDEVRITISHQPGKSSTRHMMRIDQKVVAADPLSAINAYKNLGVYIVIDEPDYGFTATTINYVVAALEAWLDSTSVGKLVGDEH